MPPCPICQTEYIENQEVISCTVCGWDLKQYPITLEGIFADKQAKITWGRKIWQQLQQQSQNLGKPALVAQPTYTGKLISAAGRDYTHLWELLTAGRWQSANEMTRTLMLRLAGREAENYIDQRASENFPSSDLKIIDQLWVKHSNGLLGFSVQKQIASEVDKVQGNTTNRWSYRNPDYRTIEWEKEFVNRVGWKNQLIYNAKAPKGHLPFINKPLSYPQHLKPKDSVIASRNLDRVAGLYALLMREDL
jgi:hypothetical protein